jgi:hypothetical protein
MLFIVSLMTFPRLLRSYPPCLALSHLGLSRYFLATHGLQRLCILSADDKRMDLPWLNRSISLPPVFDDNLKLATRSQPPQPNRRCPAVHLLLNCQSSRTILQPDAFHILLDDLPRLLCSYPPCLALSHLGLCIQLHPCVAWPSKVLHTEWR